MKKIVFILAVLLLALSAQATETVTSPDGRLSFSFEQKTDGGLFYTVSRDGGIVVSESRLGVAIDNHLFESALGVPNEDSRFWGSHWCDNLRFLGVSKESKDTCYQMPYGEWALIPDHYNQMTLKFIKGQQDEAKGDGYVKSKCYFFNIKVRAYNEGIAFCYEFPETSNGLFLNIENELTEFNIAGDAEALCTAWAQGRYQWRSLMDKWSDQAERPLTIRLKPSEPLTALRNEPQANNPSETCISLLEAGLVDYCRTKFVLEGSNRIKVELYDGVEVMTPFHTSWRLIMFGDRMTDLCNHDYMVLNLNDPQAQLVPKGSSCMTKGWGWVTPGKVFRSDLKKQSLKDAVDFAAERGLQYVHLDAGWYGPEMKMESSALKVADTKDFTIPEVVEYAKQKNIGVFVYVNQRALYKQLDQVLDSLQKWGVKGVKFGFVQVGNQQWTTWLHEAVRKCAEHHLMVDIHDEYRPTGYSRTYPNLMTAEGICGNEEMPDATHNVTLPFTRFLCGPADYTLCYYNGRVKNTKAHQLAMAAVYYSPLTWMFWYDKPAMYKGEPELEFWKEIPTTWDDTKVLQGNPGEYIVTVRRSGERWFLGAMTNTEARKVSLPLDFLTKGCKYIAHLYEDDATLNTRTKVRCSTREVDASTTLELPLLASGGAAVWFEPVALPDRADINVNKQLAYCNSQVKRALKLMPKDFTLEARNIYEGETAWNTRKATPEEWCAGFWPGVLWMDYEGSHDKNVEKAARNYTAPIADIVTKPVYDHDLGFIVINSFLKGYEALKQSGTAEGMKLSETYRAEALKAASMLASLYNDKVGTILSWPRHVKDFCGHNTIMDNMINLELLYWASQNGGNRKLAEIATRHAETTMENHFRPDGSCFHVAVYDLKTGKLKYRQTHQGYADWSMWSRGQSWAIYGYTMVYRYTRDRRFLDFAQKVTDIYLKRLQETSNDWVPKWDMDDPRGIRAPKDASTAAVVASALIELSQYVDGEKGKRYLQAARNMLADMSSENYQSGKRNVAFLMHSTGNHPAGSEIDASIIYADYYYIEALLRLKNLK